MDDKLKALEATIKQIEKEFGRGSIIKLGDTSHLSVEVIPTGILSLDVALGVGGVPRGRVTEIYGPEAGGKTTLGLSLIAESQKKGGLAAFVDVEHALDPSYASKLGVDLNNLYVSQPDTGEQALEIIEMLVRSNALDIIILDSVAALVPSSEVEGDMGDIQMGAQARLMSQALRKLTSVVGKSRTSLVFINQIREKIGMAYGNPETTPGGRALKFYSSVRIDVRRIDYLKRGNEIYGGRIRFKIVKNKLAAPFKDTEVDLIYGEGFSALGSLIEAGLNSKILQRTGAWYNYGNVRLGQGKENAAKYLQDNPKLANEVKEKVLIAISSSGKIPSEAIEMEEVEEEVEIVDDKEELVLTEFEV